MLLITLLLFLVPATALGLVLGMDRLEDSLLKAPASPTGDAAPAPTAAALP